MPIDWTAERSAAESRTTIDEQPSREATFRAAYLADEQRIQRDQPFAIETALYLLESEAADKHTEIKAAAEASDLETLARFVVRQYRAAGFMRPPAVVELYRRLDDVASRRRRSAGFSRWSLALNIH